MDEARNLSGSATTRADLDWVQRAPPLLAETGLNWRPELPSTSLLAAIDPARLDRLESLRQGRLGGYFEALAATLLEASGRYRVLARNSVIEAGNRTLGELDLLVTDRHTDTTLHIELALKFYLALPCEPGPDPACWWIGAGLRDFLTLKTRRLRDHQLRLPALARAADAWPDDLPYPQRSEVWALGRVFLPAGHALPVAPPVSAQAPSGQWLTLSEFNRRPFCGHWINKANWLADTEREDDAVLRHPLPGQFFGHAGDGRARHWFVVPDDWPAAARARILQRFTPEEADS